MRAPRVAAPLARPHTSSHTSTDASATVNARLMPGLSSGSRRRASATSISSVGSPASAQPARNWSPYAGSSSGVVTNSPPVSSIAAEATPRTIAFSSTHSRAAIGSFTT